MPKRGLYMLTDNVEYWGLDKNNWGFWEQSNKTSVRGSTDNGVTTSAIKLGWGYGSISKSITVSELSEIKVSCKITSGLGLLLMWIDDSLVWQLGEPMNWSFSPAIKMEPGEHKVIIEFFSQEFGDDQSLTYSECYIGCVKVTPYEKIDCKFASITPFIPDYSLIESKVLNEPTLFEYGPQGFAKSDSSLIFQDNGKFLYFLQRQSKICVIQDEIGILYRGIIKVSAKERVADNCYYVKCSFESPYRAGVGWSTDLDRQSIVMNQLPIKDLKEGNKYV